MSSHKFESAGHKFGYDRRKSIKNKVYEDNLIIHDPENFTYNPETDPNSKLTDVIDEILKIMKSKNMLNDNPDSETDNERELEDIKSVTDHSDIGDDDSNDSLVDSLGEPIVPSEEKDCNEEVTCCDDEVACCDDRVVDCDERVVDCDERVVDCDERVVDCDERVVDCDKEDTCCDEGVVDCDKEDTPAPVPVSNTRPPPPPPPKPIKPTPPKPVALLPVVPPKALSSQDNILALITERMKKIKNII